MISMYSLNFRIHLCLTKTLRAALYLHRRIAVLQVVSSVMERGLVVEDIKRKHLIEEHSRFSPLEQEVKNFKGPVLGYVTPVRHSWVADTEQLSVHWWIVLVAASIIKLSGWCHIAAVRKLSGWCHIASVRKLSGWCHIAAVRKLNEWCHIAAVIKLSGWCHIAAVIKLSGCCHIAAVTSEWVMSHSCCDIRVGAVT